MRKSEKRKNWWKETETQTLGGSVASTILISGFFKKKECFLLALRYSFISILRDIPEQLKTGDMFRWHNAGAIKKRLPFTCVQIQGIS